MTESAWFDTMDAHVWAQEYIKTIKEHPEIPFDEGCMIGWFANAIMAGYDKAIQQQEILTKERILDWRGLDVLMGEKPCDKCGGCGYRTYGDTSTWKHGIGGQQMTRDVCDTCWGSGIKDRPWPSWRSYVKPSDLTKLREAYEPFKDDLLDDNCVHSSWCGHTEEGNNMVKLLQCVKALLGNK